MRKAKKNYLEWNIFWGRGQNRFRSHLGRVGEIWNWIWRPCMTSIMIYLHGVLVLICFTLHYPAPLSNSEPSDQENINSAPPRISSTVRCSCRFSWKFICGSCNNVISFMIGRIILNYSNQQTKISTKLHYWSCWFKI